MIAKANSDVSDNLPSLCTAFVQLRGQHRTAILARAGRVVTGPSVMRVFNKGTRKDVLKALSRIEIEALGKIDDEETYRAWFKSGLEAVHKVIKSHNESNARLGNGAKWGHATKVLSLYVREVVLCSRYFSDGESERISRLLYVPIDGVIMKRLRALGVELRFSAIKEINSPREFFAVQEMLFAAAAKAEIPAVWFDDVWAER